MFSTAPIPWNPGQITSATKIVWFDSATAPLGATATWVNKFNPGTSDGLQPVGAQQPINTANQRKGMPGMVFAHSTGTCMTSTFTGTLSQPITVACVAKFNSVNDADSFFITDGAPSANRMTIIASAGAPGFVAGLGVNLTGATAKNTNVNLFYVEYNGASGKLFLNGGLDVSGNIGTQTVTAITVGARFSAGFNLGGPLFEYVAVNGLLSALEAGYLKGYLSTKWGVAIV